MSSRSDRANRLKELREAKLGKTKKQHRVRLAAERVIRLLVLKHFIICR